MAPSPTQLIIVAFIILLLFGTTRLSELGKGLGEGIRNFKKGIQDEPEEDKAATVEEQKPKKNRLPPRKAGASDAEEHEAEEDEAEERA